MDPNEEPQTIVVTLPPGSVPGKEMLVPLPGGRHHFKMVVPPKGKPGMQMKLKIGGVKGATIGGSAATGVEAAGAELTATEGAEGAGVEGMDAAVNVSAQTSKGAADVKKIEHPTDPMGAREARGPGETKEDGEEKVEKVEKVARKKGGVASSTSVISGAVDEADVVASGGANGGGARQVVQRRRKVAKGGRSGSGGSGNTRPSTKDKVEDFSVGSVGETKGDTTAGETTGAVGGNSGASPPPSEQVTEEVAFVDEMRELGLSVWRSFARMGEEFSLACLLTVATMATAGTGLVGGARNMYLLICCLLILSMAVLPPRTGVRPPSRPPWMPEAVHAVITPSQGGWVAREMSHERVVIASWGVAVFVGARAVSLGVVPAFYGTTDPAGAASGAGGATWAATAMAAVTAVFIGGARSGMWFAVAPEVVETVDVSSMGEADGKDE